MPQADLAEQAAGAAAAMSAVGPTSTLLVWTYLFYLVTSVALTVWVARTLHRAGRLFLIDVFQREDLADSVNHLLVVGFYLINLGYILLALRLGYDIGSLHEGIEAWAKKVGLVLLVLGLMHFFNLLVFSRIRRHRAVSSAPPPVAPDRSQGGPFPSGAAAAK